MMGKYVKWNKDSRFPWGREMAGGPLDNPAKELRTGANIPAGHTVSERPHSLGPPRRRFLAVIVPVLSLLATGSAQADKAPSHAEVTAFVTQAAEKLHRQGEASFAEFRREGGKWFQGERYVFVWGLDGTRFVYPPDPSGEGKNMLNLRDIHNKPIGAWFVQEAATQPGHGWIHYQWPKPNELFPTWKSAYIQRAVGPDGERYLVGSGQYDMPLTRPLLVVLVTDAAELLKEEGMAAFPRLRDKSDKYVFMDTYVFVLDTTGTELVNPAFPSLEGRNLKDYRDAAGNRLVNEMISRTAEGKSAWVEYYWPRPGSAEPVRKVAYVRRVRAGGDEWVIGAGMYEPSR